MPTQSAFHSIQRWKDCVAQAGVRHVCIHVITIAVMNCISIDLLCNSTCIVCVSHCAPFRWVLCISQPQRSVISLAWLYIQRATCDLRQVLSSMHTYIMHAESEYAKHRGWICFYHGKSVKFRAHMSRKGSDKRLQKFKEDYKGGFPCIQASSKGVEYAFCIYCRQDIKISCGGANDITRHLGKKKHRYNEQAEIKVCKMLMKLTSFIRNEDISLIKTEVQFTDFLVEHNIAINGE